MKVSRTSRLNGEYQKEISEIIRLIGGDVNDETAIAHARKMISDADNYKSTIN